MAPAAAHMHVLIIEDDVKLNALFSKHLQSAGYVLQGVETVETARHVLTHFPPPDLVVLDLLLGDGHGNEILDLLQQPGFEDTRVIVVSGTAFAATHGLEHYLVDRVLLKPVSPRGLTALVKDLL